MWPTALRILLALAVFAAAVLAYLPFLYHLEEVWQAVAAWWCAGSLPVLLVLAWNRKTLLRPGAGLGWLIVLAVVLSWASLIVGVAMFPRGGAGR